MRTDDGVKWLGKGKIEMKIGDGEEFATSECGPDLGLFLVAFWAAAVVAGMVGIVLPATAITPKEMAAPNVGSAGEDIPKRAPMARKHGLPILLHIRIAVAVEDLRHFPHGLSPSGLEIG